MVTILLPAINPGGWKEDQKINEKKEEKKKDENKVWGEKWKNK